MKMVFMSFFEGKTDEVTELLESENVEFYTRLDQVKGKSLGFRPRMGTQVWPGYNGAVLFPVQDEQVDRLLDKVNRFNEETEYEGISAFVFDIAKMVVKKPSK